MSRIVTVYSLNLTVSEDEHGSIVDVEIEDPDGELAERFDLGSIAARRHARNEDCPGCLGLIDAALPSPSADQIGAA